MAPLISCKSISKAYGSKDLFHDLEVNFCAGDCVGLIGPNGAGKSSLLKLIGKKDSPDCGEIIYGKEVRIGFVPQYVEQHLGTLREVLDETLVGPAFEDIGVRENHIRRILGQVGLHDPEKKAKELSGGLTRRLTLAKALVNEPNVLLLDEPTNHLDLDTILWLESFLKRSFKTFIVTSHDRAFLDHICTQVWELSHCYPQGLFAVEGTYSDFLESKKTFLLGQKQYERSLRSKHVREQEWLKQTPQARTTKSRARIQEAARIEHELAKVKWRNTERVADLGFKGTDRQTKKLLAAKNLSKTYDHKTLFSKVDLNLMKGDRLGIVGGNGCGKSTLLKILAGEIETDSGTVKYAEDLKIFHFDQHRVSLDLNLTLKEALSPNSDTIQYRGGTIHINSWCEKFLFDKTALGLPIKFLSGGERARIPVARLMMEPADILFLDEPTNDLDIDTLEILEQSLDDFPGAVVLISHDRALIDRVSDSLLALDENGIHQTFNDSSTWLKHRQMQQKEKSKLLSKPSKKEASKKSSLSYKEKKELSQMDEKITALNEDVEKLSKKLEDPIQIQDAEFVQKIGLEISKKQKEIDRLYERWQELEDKQSL